MCDHRNYSILASSKDQCFTLCNDCNASITETYDRDDKGRITHIEIEIEYQEDWIPEEMTR